MHPETGEDSGRQWATGVEREKERKGKQGKLEFEHVCIVCVFVCMCSQGEKDQMDPIDLPTEVCIERTFRCFIPAFAS